MQVREGKMVLELRPRINWNKGSAVLWILSVLGLLAMNLTLTPPRSKMLSYG